MFTLSSEDRQQIQQELGADALTLDLATGERLLCLKVQQSADLLQFAHNILDEALNRFCPGISRTDLVEDDASVTVVSHLRGRAAWHESFANKLSLAPHASRNRSGACGMGSNQRHRKRVTSLAMAALLICENCHSQQVHAIFACHQQLRILCRLCLASMDEALGPPPETPAPAAHPSHPAPAALAVRSPQTPAERLQHLAMSLGADQEVLHDPFLFVQEESGNVMCAACNKCLTAAHTESKKHTGYLSNVDGTLSWLRAERPLWQCLRMLELAAPAAPANYSAWGNYQAPQGPQGQGPQGPPQGPQGPQGPEGPRQPEQPVTLEPPPMPTDEEIFDFLMTLTGRKWRCWDARWFSTEDPQPIRYPGRPLAAQCGPSDSSLPAPPEEEVVEEV